MHTWKVVPLACLVLCAAPGAQAESIVIDGLEFESWQAYAESDYFRNEGKRCGTQVSAAEDEVLRGGGDCTLGSTNPLPIYDPGDTYTLNVVVHVITSGATGNVSDALIQSNIDILNEDFQAIAGTNGANGTDAAIQFQLATEDPDGNPTNGITRTNNPTWFNDSGAYYNTLAWDTNRYINVYTNSASGALGYVPNLPQGGIVGTNQDRIVVLWSTMGLNSPFGPPFHLGRTLTHEMGHYLGLYHTFNAGSCTGASPACYSAGDRICDTNPESSPTGGCPANRVTCGQPAPVDNYMDYSDDICMEMFTPEQVRRMRCTLENYRSDLITMSAVSSPVVGVASGVSLLAQNIPNPFSPTTQISFALPIAQSVTLKVIDVSGRTVRTLAEGAHTAGQHQVLWDGTNASNQPVAAGVYFYRLDTPQGSETRRMVKMK